MNSATQLKSPDEEPRSFGPRAEAPHPVISVKVAQGMEELMQGFAVRAAVFLSELQCPYAEEFDGNDFSATHFLGMIGDEPASTCRVRYFSDFARLERVAVRREFRKTGIGGEMIKFAVDLCRQKGYRKLHGHAEARLLPFWQKFGFEHLFDGDAKRTFVLLDTEYFELTCDLEAHPDPIAIGNDPMMFIRPEGDWERPCALELAGEDPSGDPSAEDDDGEEEDWEVQLQQHMQRFGTAAASADR